MRKLKLIIGTILMFILTACGLKEKLPNAQIDDSLQKISRTELNNIMNKKIIFGHQSVGGNILSGLELIGEQDNKLKFNIIQDPDFSKLNIGVLGHFKCGLNKEPYSKIKDFKDKIENNYGGKVDIAFMKFCYIDIFEDTDIEMLFSEYTNMLDSLENKFPEIIFIHVTIPLRVHENKKNILRHQYNEMLRKKYSGIEPIFDIAQVESTKPDGDKVLFKWEGEQYPKLYKGYASDAGHLNKPGQWYAAKELILTLNNVVNEK